MPGASEEGLSVDGTAHQTHRERLPATPESRSAVEIPL
ncbi:hypothetical protein ATN83_p10155 (plasmid) [Raoultella ornithinolytica]|nr:hypothetical protein ATN83_p10155 [Raoultella ornithinolytica]